MRFTKTIVAALLALLLAMGAVVSISAQDSSDLDFEGLEKAYGRTFNADMMAMIDVEDPEALPTGWFMLTTMVLEFDSEDSASAGFEQFNEQTTEDALGEGVSLEDVELDLDLEYSAVQAVEEIDGITTNVAVVTALDGEYVYAVSGITFGDDPVAAIESVIGEMQEAEAGDGEGTFDADGASEGGLWDKLPASDSNSVEMEALTELSDAIYFPEQESTPAA